MLVRERDLAADRHAALVEWLDEALPPDGTVTVASPAIPLTTTGLHLRARDPSPRIRPRALSRSVHSVAEAATATAERCDWITLSPVHPSPSKPGYGPALGPDGIARVLDAVPDCPPVLALGGVTSAVVPDLLRAGAHGVAVMGAVMRAPDPGTAITELLRTITATHEHIPSPTHRPSTTGVLR